MGKILILAVLATLLLACGSASELGRQSRLDLARETASSMYQMLGDLYPHLIFNQTGQIWYRGRYIEPVWRIDNYWSDWFDVWSIPPSEVCRIDFHNTGSYRDYQNAVAFYVYTWGAPECRE